MTLMLHAGAREVDFDALRAVPMPEATDTHLPIAHHEIVELMRFALTFYGHQIMHEKHAVMPNGQRYFGLMTLRSPYGEYADVVGLRNSHDKSFPIGVAYGSRVFVCDNMSFIGDHVIRRRHTARAKRELLGLLNDIVQPLAETRAAQAATMVTYQTTSLTDELADHGIVEMIRQKVISTHRIDAVMAQWDSPTHPCGEKTAWRLFNAATFVLADKVMERPKLTRALHGIIDGICERVHA